MKLKLFALLFAASFLFSSCATILGGPTTTHQSTKPMKGEPRRIIKGEVLLVDAFCGLFPVLVDFATGAIYRPNPDPSRVRK